MRTVWQTLAVKECSPLQWIAINGYLNVKVNQTIETMENPFAIIAITTTDLIPNWLSLKTS